MRTLHGFMKNRRLFGHILNNLGYFLFKLSGHTVCENVGTIVKHISSPPALGGGKPVLNCSAMDHFGI